MTTCMCPACNAPHVHPYVYCQECGYEMNPLQPIGLMVQIPRHFKAANEGGYTQRELLRENDDYHREMQDR